MEDQKERTGLCWLPPSSGAVKIPPCNLQVFMIAEDFLQTKSSDAIASFEVTLTDHLPTATYINVKPRPTNCRTTGLFRKASCPRLRPSRYS